jgi:hypothetical protein
MQRPCFVNQTTGPVSGKRLRLRDKMRNRLRDSHAHLPRARVDLADLHYGGKARRPNKCPYRQWWHACHGRYAAANMLDDVMPDGSIRVLAFLLQRAFPF